MDFSTFKRRRAPSVIIVSLIDVLLVVLIFLMATTAFKKEQASLKLALPESKISKAGAADTKPPMVISVTTNAPYLFLGSTPVTIERIQSDLTSGVKANPNLRVAIRADKRAPFGEIIKVIDAAKLANVSSIDAFTEKTGQ
jgi:biopolymer transport protein ExbD